VDTIRDFEDMLGLLDRHQVRYLIVGGLAFIFHAKPRYTKDMDLWLDPDPDNVRKANNALSEFGSPQLLDPNDPDEILQIGSAPNRIDLIRRVVSADFSEAWSRRISSRYGRAKAQWVDLDTLIEIKSQIDHPRHREDTRVLEMVRQRKSSTG
jgi:hypothetical protein